MITISQEQKQFIDTAILDTYHWFSEEEQIVLDESEDNGEERILEAQLQNFHKLSITEELHYLMKSWNWDDGSNIPNLVLTNPLCDRGTALMVYWMMDPDYFSNSENIPDYQKEDYEHLKNLEQRLLNDEFKISKIKFDPTSYASVKEWENPKIPVELKSASPGEEFENLIAFS